MTSGYCIIGHKHVKSAVAIQWSSLQNDISVVAEANVALPICANTAKKLFMQIWAYSMIDAGALPIPCVFTVMKNGVATALTVSVAATGTFSVTADVAFNDGDTFSIQCDPRNDYSAGSVTFQAVLCFLSP
jgi:hypothetical protein